MEKYRGQSKGEPPRQAQELIADVSPKGVVSTFMNFSIVPSHLPTPMILCIAKKFDSESSPTVCVRVLDKHPSENEPRKEQPLRVSGRS